MQSTYSILVTCPKGIEGLLADELKMLGLSVLKTNPRGVFLDVSLESLHRVRLWSRLANRIYVILGVSREANRNALHRVAEGIDWSRYLKPEFTIWISGQGNYGDLRHSGFAAQVVKDGIFDGCRRNGFVLPELKEQEQTHRIHVNVGKETYILLDVLGQSLHQRGYRIEGGAAPLKENLAAALLIRAGWPGERQVFMDPMCGSGTLLIEATYMALDQAPGLLASFKAPVDPLIRDEALTARLYNEALDRQRSAEGNWKGSVLGSDLRPEALAIASRNIARAGLARFISVRADDAGRVLPPDARAGLLVTNPPYGERLGQKTELLSLYRALGEHWRKHFGGWRIGVFTSQEDLAREMGLSPDKVYRLANGPLDAQLALYDIHALEDKRKHQQQVAERLAQQEGSPNAEPEWSDQAQMLVNRLKKNLKKRKPWAEKNRLEAWRLYDADMPEYAVAIDLYGDHALVQEYAPPKSIDPQKAAARLKDVMAVVPHVLGIPRKRIALKQRMRQKGKAQYVKLSEQRKEFPVVENGVRLLVNLEDYLDTGVFLDHRPTRFYIQQHARNLRFLNLFCYTGAATVHACAGGARETCSVDLSQTYLDWAERNLTLNGFASKTNRIVRANVMEWLSAEKSLFDLIFVDPPTFSNSKRMEGVFDVQRDHVALLDLAMSRLSPKGLLIFSTNFRKFVLDEGLALRYQIEEVTAKSIPEDFGVASRIHRCWQLRKPVVKETRPWG